MRFVELRPPADQPGDPAAVLSVHPRFTVVHAKADQPRRIIAAVVDTIGGTAAGPVGILDCRGILLDFSPETIRLLDVAPQSRIVVRPDDLPLRPPSPARLRRDAIERELNQLDALTSDAISALARSKTLREEAEIQLQSARSELEAVLNEQIETDLAAVSDDDPSSEGIGPLAVQGDTVAPDVWRERRDAVAHTLEAAIDEHEVALRALHSLAGEPSPDRDEMLARRGALVDELSAISLADVEQIRGALAAYETIAAHVGAFDPRRAQLLTEWRDLSTRIGLLPAANTRPNPQLIAMAKARVRAAERALEEARTAARSVRDPVVRSAIEQAHDAVEKAESQAGKSRGRAASRERLDLARASEATLLSQFGLSSYSEFLVATVTRPDENAAAVRIDVAQAELERTRAMLAAAREVEPATVERTELEAAREVLRNQIGEYLGADPGNDVERSLGSVNDPGFLDAREQLARLLRMDGVAIDGPDPLESARRHVDQADAALARRRQLTDELIVLDSRLQVVPDDLATATEAPDGPDAGAPWAGALARVKAAQGRIDEVRAELAALEPPLLTEPPSIPVELHAALLPPPQALAELKQAAEREEQARRRRVVEAHERRVREAEPQLGAFRDRLHEAIAAEQRASGELHNLEERTLALSSELVEALEDEDADAVDDALLLSQTEFRDIEFAVLTRLSGVRNAYFGGSVPLIIDDAFRGVPSAQRSSLLGLVDRLADNTQVIYLSDDADTIVWGERQSPDRVLVTSF